MMGEALRVGAKLRLAILVGRPAPEHGLAADTARLSCGGESSKHSLKDKLEDDELGRISVPKLKPEIWPSGCRRLGMAEVENPLVLGIEGRRRVILRRLGRGQLHVQSTSLKLD